MTVSKLKKKLDNIFSRYIRLRAADRNGNVVCYTCDRVYFWKKIQNGHFITRSKVSTRFDEDNCRPQCYGCNVMQQGRQYEFSKRLDLERKGLSNEVYIRSNKILKLGVIDYKEKITHYTKEVERIAAALDIEL